MHCNRRQFAYLLGAGAAVSMLPEIRGQAPARTAAVAGSVKALIFDTFGTVVDWRGSIIAEGTAWGKAKGVNVDWARFADQWRDGYRPAMERVVQHPPVVATAETQVLVQKGGSNWQPKSSLFH